MPDGHLNVNWDDVVCPICLDYPHNCVLLRCTSHGKGCLTFVCDTNHSHSNCLDRFRSAYDVTSSPSVGNALTATFNSVVLGSSCRPACPLCRGQVQGWVVIDDARTRLNNKRRCCDEFKCSFTGTFTELQQHVKEEHPYAQPSKVDPARQLDWENFQQSSEIIDVLSTIHSEVPRGVVLGDYVIDYGNNETGDDFEDFPGDDGNWWTSCILFQVFKKIRSSRSGRRSIVNDRRRGSRHSRNDTSNSDAGSVTSVEFADYRLDELDDEFVITRGSSRTSAPSRRRRHPGLLKRDSFGSSQSSLLSSQLALAPGYWVRSGRDSLYRDQNKNNEPIPNRCTTSAKRRHDQQRQHRTRARPRRRRKKATRKISSSVIIIKPSLDEDNPKEEKDETWNARIASLVGAVKRVFALHSC